MTIEIKQPAAAKFAPHWNPDAYAAAYLSFHAALPTALDPTLPDDVYNAVAFQLANPETLASYEYMQAYVDSFATASQFPALNSTAFANIDPAVQSFIDVQFKHPGIFEIAATINLTYQQEIAAAVTVAVIGQFGDWGMF